MLTPVQEIILRGLFLEPEDKTAFKRAQAASRQYEWRSLNRERVRGRKKELWALNRDKNLDYKRAWAEKNRERLRAASREAYWRDPEESRARGRESARRNWPTKKPQQAAYARERYLRDPSFRFSVLVRTRIRRALSTQRSYKTNKTSLLVGCSFGELRGHLEKQFRPGMTWENHGAVWHIDHKLPCASFDLTDPAQQRKCFHYSNLQPLFAEENFKKGARLDYCK